MMYRSMRLASLAAIAACLVLGPGCARMKAQARIDELKNPPVTRVVIDTIAEAGDLPVIVPLEGPSSLIPEGCPPPLHVEGNMLLNPGGERVRLVGVNIASLEWTDEGENVLQSLEVAIDDWGANLVRVPLSQDRWFGRSPTQTDGGARYREVVDAMVVGAAERGAYILLELHWNNAGVWGSHIGQHPMPDQGSLLFWTALARRYANHPAVLMGPYNEPHDVSWDVWLSGGVQEEDVRSEAERTPENPIPRVRTKVKYRAVGMQELYDAIRAQGATANIVVIGGLDWAYDLSGILNGYAVQGCNIVYDSHVYPNKDWKPEFSWKNAFLVPADHVPVLIGEWGGSPSDEPNGFIEIFVKLLRRNDQLHWTAWCFHPSAGPPLLRNWDYEPNATGEVVIEEIEAARQQDLPMP